MEFLANLSQLNTVVSTKVIWLILWYFSCEFDRRVEIVSPFNEPIYLFSVAIPKGKKNILNVTFPFFWFGFALIVGLISFQFPPWKYWQMALLFSYPKRFHVLEEALLNELKPIFFKDWAKHFREVVRWDQCVMIEELFVCFSYYICSFFLTHICVPLSATIQMSTRGSFICC